MGKRNEDRVRQKIASGLKFYFRQGMTSGVCIRSQSTLEREVSEIHSKVLILAEVPASGAQLLILRGSCVVGVYSVGMSPPGGKGWLLSNVSRT